MKHIKNFSLIILPLFLAAGLFIAFNLFDPLTIGIGGIMIVFSLIYFLCLSLLYALLRDGSRIWNNILAKKTSIIVSNKKQISPQRAYLIASVLALVPIILLAVGSYSQLGVWDLILVLFFLAVSVLYIQKTIVD